MPLGGLTDEIDVTVFRSHVKIPLIFLVPAAFAVTLYAASYLYANSGWFIDQLTTTLHAQMGGHFRVAELVVEPSMTDVHVYGVEIETPDRRPVVDADEVFASIDPLVLLNRRLSFDKTVARGADIRLEFDEEGDFGLLQAFGAGERDEPRDPDEEGGSLSVEFADIEVRDSKISFIQPDFRFDIPDVDLPSASIAIEPETLLMRVDRLDMPRVDFVFARELMRMPPEKGDWRFSVEDGVIRDWRWANDGFTVGEVSFMTEGIRLDAQGQMAFPGGEEANAPTMTYDASASISVPYWSPLAQYFVDDAIHFEIPEMRVAAEGTLEEIDGAARLRASRVETAGLHFRDVEATVALRDQWIDVTQATAQVHGGRLEVPEAYFNMFTIQYGASGRFEGVDPRSLMQDFEVDLPWLAGRARGGFEVHGGVPLLPDSAARDPYRLAQYAEQKYAEVTITEDWVLQRRNRLLAPASTAVLTAGSNLWVDMDRVVLPEAQLRLDSDLVRVEDFRLDYQKLFFEDGPDDEPARLFASISDIGPWASLYGLDGVSGGASLSATVSGPLASPDLSLDLRNRQSPMGFPGTDVAADDLRLRLGLRRGRLSIHEARVATQVGRAGASGWIDLLQPPSRARSTSESTFALRRVQPANLKVSAEQVDLSKVGSMLGLAVPVRGILAASGQLEGTLQQPRGQFEASIDDGGVLNQPVPSVRLAGAVGRDDVVVEKLSIDAGRAGAFDANGRYGFDGSYSFELDAERIDFDQIGPLALLPDAARPHGRARLALHGEGSLEEPAFGGDLQVRDLAVGARDLGDVALVVNTVDDTVYVTGATLPLATVQVEVPLDTSSPYYVRLGMEQLELTDVLAELGESPVVSRAEATGMVEFFMEKDFSRYQILAYLTQLEVDTLGRTIDNRGPLVVGWNNGEVLQVQQATIGTGDHYVSVEGAMVTDPLLLDLKVDGQADLSLLNTLRRAFPDTLPAALVNSRGYLDIDGSFRGPIDKLVADARVDFHGAELAIRGLGEPIRVASGRVNFERDRVWISREKPVNGNALGGVFNVAGELSLKNQQLGRLELSAWSHNMNYRVPDTANLTFDTDVRWVAGDLTRPETWKVSGRVDVLDGLFYRDISLFEQEVTGRVLGAFDRRTERYEASIFDQMPELQDIQLDLAVRARDGFEIRNQIDRLGLDLDLRVDLRLQDTLVEPYVTGDVDVSSGQVGFQGEEFLVRSGTVRFTGDSANPWIDVSAGADIRNRCREGQLQEDFQTDMTLSGDLNEDEEQYYHVKLNLQGYADNLDMQFDSTPYADQRDILSLLLTGCTVDQLTASSASGPTLEIALGPLLGRIEKEIQDVVKVSEFTIMPGVERTQVRIGDRLTRRLSWNFQLDTGMAETAGGQRYQLEYKLSDQWSAELSERSQTETNNFLLDLKLKYRIPLN